MAMTATQSNALSAFNTPTPSNPIWFENPPWNGVDGEDPEDKKTPERVRGTYGDYYFLVEKYEYMSFPPPEVRARLKAAGKKIKPLVQRRYFMHFLHSTRLTARTLKVYLHQGKYYYSDSLDYSIRSAAKSAPPKTREILIKTLGGMLGIGDALAEIHLEAWTNGR